MMDSAASIVERVRGGELSARAIVDESLDRIAERTDLNAFITVTADAARTRADEIDATVARGDDPGPLAGVPIAYKDVLATKGVQTTCGSLILEGWNPPYTATAVARLADAGAVMVGKTNQDEFAMGSSNENSAYGPARNPHNTDRVPGGSSGGSAVAVAADLAPLALGTDTGGSIRQPAALCGIVGMKPTYGRISRYGLVAFASSLDQIGPLAANVRDAAITFEAMAGEDPRDATCIPEPSPNVVDSLERGLDGLRFGVIKEFAGVGFEPGVSTAFDAALSRIENAGAEIVEVSLPSVDYALSAYYIIAPAEASSNLARFDGVRYGLRVGGDDVETMNRLTRAAGFGDEVKRRIMLGTYALSAGYYDAYYGKAQKVRTLIIRDFEAAYEKADVLCSPTSPTVAFEIGARTQDPLAMYLSDVCTAPTNLAGHPGISIPCGTAAAGLPVGFQVLAPALAEPLMFQAAAGVEAAFR